LPAAASRILDEVRGALPHDLAAASISAARLASLLRESVEVPAARPAMSKGGLASWQERKVREYINSNLDNQILVEDLADLVSLSAAHFCRAFKKSFCSTPHAYIVQHRVIRAQELMRATRSPLSQIALDCGFADQTHLSKLFRRLTGRTPNAWRRAYAMAA
jgi:transcriptional regulator GlxA family with amidase domain